MTWECSECGALRTRARAPVSCVECGRAGIIFVPADIDGESGIEAGSLRTAWIQAGFLAAEQHA